MRKAHSENVNKSWTKFKNRGKPNFTYFCQILQPSVWKYSKTIATTYGVLWLFRHHMNVAWEFYQTFTFFLWLFVVNILYISAIKTNNHHWWRIERNLLSTNYLTCLYRVVCVSSLNRITMCLCRHPNRQFATNISNLLLFIHLDFVL